MTIDQLREALPDYAKDIRLNLSSISREEGVPGLSAEQAAGIALASADATKDQALIAAYAENVAGETVEAAKAAATIMAMNNIYYRFTHLVGNESYQKMPANLRMSVIGKPGIDKATFELMSLAISAINGCGRCMEAHERELVKAGVSEQGIQSAVRIAAVLNATAQARAIGSVGTQLSAAA